MRPVRIVESRRYIRHPSDIPIEYKIAEGEEAQEKPMADVGIGGLSFHVDEPVSIGQHLQLCIPSVRPDMKIDSIVSWCEQTEQGYQIGIKFVADQDRFMMRMVEQICHIETYRRRILEQEGRQLSAAEAAREWISLYAEDFPTA